MNCTKCGNQLPAKAKFCPECGTEVPPKQAEVTAKQDVETVEGTATGIVANEGALDKGIRASSEQNVGTVRSGGTVTGVVIGSDEGQTFVGGQHDHGDNVGGDKITVGDISDSTGLAIGSGASATVTQGLDADEIAALFAPIHQKIADLPDDPDVDKEELTETVQKIEKEVAKGEEASPKRVERWLKTIVLMSEDIFEVATATLINPAAGVATVIKKVAAKAREEADPT